MASPTWRRIRRVWITVGIGATVGFVLWSALAFRASPHARRAILTDSLVRVLSFSGHWSFIPAAPAAPRATLLFFPGAQVQPEAYAPLLRHLAERGYPSVLIRLPWRGAFGRADGPEVLEAARTVMDTVPGPWVVAGHSKGAVLAARLARAGAPRLAGLVLVGTTHPRDFSLADLPYHVGKVYGTADGIAPLAKVRANAHLLPASTHWVEIEGGNHSQFGSYGFQPLDHVAGISRAEQQERTVAALLAALDAAGAVAAGATSRP